MSYRTNSDNLYSEGTLILAKLNPGSSLIIKKYFNRIYYCQPVSNPESKLLVYFERELVLPIAEV